MSTEVDNISERLEHFVMAAPATPPASPPERKATSSGARSSAPLNPAKLFDDIGTRYDEAFADRTQQNRSIEWVLDTITPNASVLDVGCGPGSVTSKINNAGHNVLGIDVSSVMVSAAKQKVPGAKFEQVDFRDFYVAGDTYDAIVMQFALIAGVSRSQILEAFSKVHWMLKSGGLFAYASVAVSGDRVKTQFLGRPIVASAFSTEETVQWLKDVGFEIVEKYEDQYQAKHVDGLCAPEDVTPEPHVYICARKK